MKLLHLTCLALPLVVIVTGCNRRSSSEAKAPPPAQVKTVKEESLSTLTLSPEAEQRLGIEVAPVEKRRMQRTRTLAGEVILPLAGTNGVQSVYSLLPAMAPSELVRVAELQADADALVLTTRVQLDSAKVTLERAATLLSSKAGSARAVDDARAQVALAEANLKAAENRRQLLGAPVFEAARQDVLWVRAPIYVADVKRVLANQPAQIGSLADSPGSSGIAARPMAAPFSSTPGAATVDLFYEVRNTNDFLRPGQKVSVTLRLADAEESPAVPWSAVIHDAYGGTWVYEQIAPLAYARRRVVLHHVLDGFAAIEAGPPLGAKIVTTSVPELFGTEMGFAK